MRSSKARLRRGARLPPAIVDNPPRPSETPERLPAGFASLVSAGGVRYTHVGTQPVPGNAIGYEQKGGFVRFALKNADGTTGTSAWWPTQGTPWTATNGQGGYSGLVRLPSGFQPVVLNNGLRIQQAGYYRLPANAVGYGWDAWGRLLLALADGKIYFAR